MSVNRPFPHTVETKDSKRRFHGSKNQPFRSVNPPPDRKSLPQSTPTRSRDYAHRPYKSTQRYTASPVLIDNILELPSPPPILRHSAVTADTGSANEGWASWAVQEDFKKVIVNLSHTVDSPSPVLGYPPMVQGHAFSVKPGNINSKRGLREITFARLAELDTWRLQNGTFGKQDV